MKKDNKEYISELEEWLKERKKDLYYSLEQFDKLIIMLASGGLVLTIGFVRDIVKITPDTDTSLLKSCWYLLAGALIIALFAQISSYNANRLEIKKTRKEINELKETGEFNDKSNSMRIINFLFQTSNFSVKLFNVSSFILLIIGIISFIIFVNQNL